MPNIERLWEISTPEDFNALALQIFQYQRANCRPYGDFCSALGRQDIRTIEDIPFLPISMFKSHHIGEGELTFRSSGTTGESRSEHRIKNPELYKESYMRNFTSRYGNPDKSCILALLPSYLERNDSSLVYMADGLIRQSAHPSSGFYLNDYRQLREVLEELKAQKKPTILIGVSFALMDMSEQHPIDFPELILIETGGMKGRREEPTREELHDVLKAGFGVKEVHSEYGMTELLSQAYSSGHGVFSCPPWMKVLGREPDDPMSYAAFGRTAGLNFIDLANVHSCSFIATDDLGRVREDGSFEVIGRFDASDLRGCSLLHVV